MKQNRLKHLSPEGMAFKRLIQKRATRHIWEFRKGSRSSVLAQSVQRATAAFPNISAFMEPMRTSSVWHELVWTLSCAKSILCLMESQAVAPIDAQLAQGHWVCGQVCQPGIHTSAQAWLRWSVLPLLAGGTSGSLPRVSGREFGIRLSSCDGPSTLLLLWWGHKGASVMWVS